MHVIYDVSHNIAKIEEHMVEGKQKTLLVHRKVSEYTQYIYNMDNSMNYININSLKDDIYLKYTLSIY